MPVQIYGIGYINILAGAYQLLHDVYGLISDSELDEKTDALLEGFLGTSVSNRSEIAANTPVPSAGTDIYEDMTNMYETRRGFPITGELTINQDGTFILKTS